MSDNKKMWLGLSGKKGIRLRRCTTNISEGDHKVNSSAEEIVSRLFRDTIYTESGDLVPRECCAEGLCGTPTCSCVQQPADICPQSRTYGG